MFETTQITLQRVISSVVKGDSDPRSLGRFLVYGSGDYKNSSAYVGSVLQSASHRWRQSVGKQKRKLQGIVARLLDAQLEALKLLENPELL